MLVARAEQESEKKRVNEWLVESGASVVNIERRGLQFLNDTHSGEAPFTVVGILLICDLIDLSVRKTLALGRPEYGRTPKHMKA